MKEDERTRIHKELKESRGDEKDDETVEKGDDKAVENVSKVEQ